MVAHVLWYLGHIQGRPFDLDISDPLGYKEGIEVPKTLAELRKPASPVKYMVRRPNISASRPKVIISMVVVITLMSSIQLPAALLASKWRTTVGMATFSALTELLEKKLAKPTTDSVRHACRMRLRSES
nr:hypothetical protein [Nocardia jiangxiensis]